MRLFVHPFVDNTPSLTSQYVKLLVVLSAKFPSLPLWNCLHHHSTVNSSKVVNSSHKHRRNILQQCTTRAHTHLKQSGFQPHPRIKSTCITHKKHTGKKNINSFRHKVVANPRKRNQCGTRHISSQKCCGNIRISISGCWALEKKAGWIIANNLLWVKR